MTLRHARCHFHKEREAAARCPHCGRDFCRECITDFDGVVYCRPCLAAFHAQAARDAGWRAWVGAALILGAAVLVQAAVFLALLRPLANLNPGRPAAAASKEAR